MAPAPLIRQLNPADRDAFFQLRLRALLAHPESFGQSHQEALERGPQHYDAVLQGARAAEGNFVLGAFTAEDQALIGMVGLTRQERIKDLHKASVVGMYVAAEAAGRGVGRALLTELLARADRVEGLRQIQLVVASKNDAARRLYESVGFRPYGREIEGLCVNGVFSDLDLMARFI
ncbi:GNAT family N-acetyltransferase [Paraburkholderia phenazinium]|jgi:RimJ/RimL family protein N-acetyltransferase|uniref:Protein N-acetyltransferase, RimJ/RimL family n=1 Tax=Paraburkholderia phenazinium TaxID=60549 RepID=A0A1N6H871_9BURK|nr:GNAT family protein [Paraburkholderia phenazinium]SIO15930.1 Protein N-acetyltransferase, RimJ/RimL family [Paraburkholderia phenazinium]